MGFWIWGGQLVGIGALPRCQSSKSVEHLYFYGHFSTTYLSLKLECVAAATLNLKTCRAHAVSRTEQQPGKQLELSTFLETILKDRMLQMKLAWN